MLQQSEYSRISDALVESLHLPQPPVAISFASHLPDGVPPHAGTAPAGCRFWEDATAARFFTSAADHHHCAIGVYTHNLQISPLQQVDLVDALKVFGELGYLREQDLALVPVLQSHPEYIIYSPLADTPLPPDVVILFVNANQTLICSEAAQQVENQNAPALGRPACAVVPQVTNTGRGALSLGCCGARAYLDVLTDNVVVFAIPGAKLESYQERISTLARANTILSKFHQIRRSDIEAGKTPTVKESLTAMAT
jgi:uncharacterized protein (DUF169 family)